MGLDKLFNVQTSIENGAPEVEVKVDRMRAGMYNIDINTVVTQIQDQLEGKNAGQLERDGEMRDMLETHYSDTVQFHGTVDNMDQHWKGISLLCMTSRFEGMPLAALEAMSNGVPVIAYDVGDLGKVIDSDINGWLIQQGNFEEFIAKINKFIKMPKAMQMQMRKSSRKKIENNYSASKIVDQITEIYSKLINSNVKNVV